ncbi:MAG: hypothetical protein RSB93_04075 [Rikenellaceae bacterium]
MKNISNIEDLLSLDNNITTRKRNPIIAIIMTLIGAAILAFTLSKGENSSMNAILLFTGSALFVIGLIELFRKKLILYHSPSGEKIVCKQCFFSLEDKKMINEYIEKKEFDKLANLSSNNNSKIMAILYTTKSMGYNVIQLLEYIDYQYTPIDEPIVK